MLGIDSREVLLALPAHPSVVGTAREAAEELRDLVSPDGLDHLQLVVSELVTNAIRHSDAGATDRIELRIAVLGGTILVEVRDPGPGFARPSGTPRPRGATGGFGLFLVDRLASKWGVSNDGRFRVWAELPA